MYMMNCVGDSAKEFTIELHNGGFNFADLGHILGLFFFFFFSM
jgi:hypothetical protein